MTGDNRYEEILSCEGKDVVRMCDVAEILQTGIDEKTLALAKNIR